jgi:hypothetical protein
MIGFINTSFTITLNHNEFTTTHNQSSAEPLTAEDSLHSHSRYTTDFCSQVKSSHIATDGQSVSQSVSQSWMGLMTRYLLLFDSYGLLIVGRPL